MSWIIWLLIAVYMAWGSKLCDEFLSEWQIENYLGFEEVRKNQPELIKEGDIPTTPITTLVVVTTVLSSPLITMGVHLENFFNKSEEG